MPIIRVPTVKLTPGIDSYTKLLLHMDGSDNGTTFTDECGKTVTRSGVVTKTGVKKFGTASAYFDGTDDYLTVPNSSDFAFGTDAFTIDCWVKTSATTTLQKIIDKYADGGAQVAFAIVSNGAVLGHIWKSSYSINITSSAVVNDGNWHHVAFVVDSGGKSGRICVDGAVTEGTSSTAVEATSTGVLNIGRGYNDANRYNGYLDELRISKGIARWTSDFIPPVCAYY